MDKRPRRQDGTLYPPCKECNIKPNECKGVCIIQRIAKQAEEINRRDKHGNRIQRHGRIK